MDIKKTANLLLNFTLKRLAEISGIITFSVGILLFIALFSYSPEDPNFIFPKDTKIKNLLGFQGSFVSDLFFQSFGFIAYLISMVKGRNRASPCCCKKQHKWHYREFQSFLYL